MSESTEGKMISKKEGETMFSFIFLVLGFAFLFSLSSLGCGKNQMKE